MSNNENSGSSDSDLDLSDADALYDKAWKLTQEYRDECKKDPDNYDNEDIHIFRDSMWRAVLKAIAAGPSAKDARTLALAALGGIHEGFWYA